MAEVLGVVASAVQVADLGFKLSKNIYSYAEATLAADVRIAHLGRDVKLTSMAIKELGKVFEEAKVQALLKDEALSAATEAMDACNNIFKSMQAALEKSKSSKLKLSWPFRQLKVEVLNTDLDRLKCTLMLLMKVLLYAQSAHQRKFDDEKLENIENMICERNRIMAKHEAALSMANGGCPIPWSNFMVNGTASASNRLYSFPAGSTTGQAPISRLSALDLSKDQNEPVGLNMRALDQAKLHIDTLLRHVESVKLGITAMGTAHPREANKLKCAYLDTRDLLDNILLSGLNTKFGSCCQRRNFVSENTTIGIPFQVSINDSFSNDSTMPVGAKYGTNQPPDEASRYMYPNFGFPSTQSFSSHGTNSSAIPHFGRGQFDDDSQVPSTGLLGSTVPNLDLMSTDTHTDTAQQQQQQQQQQQEATQIEFASRASSQPLQSFDFDDPDQVELAFCSDGDNHPMENPMPAPMAFPRMSEFQQELMDHPMNLDELVSSASVAGNTPAENDLEARSLPASDNGWSTVDFHQPNNRHIYDSYSDSHSATVFNPIQTLHIRTGSDVPQSAHSFGSLEEIPPFPMHPPHAMQHGMHLHDHELDPYQSPAYSVSPPSTSVQPYAIKQSASSSDVSSPPASRRRKSPTNSIEAATSKITKTIVKKPAGSAKSYQSPAYSASSPSSSSPPAARKRKNPSASIEASTGKPTSMIVKKSTPSIEIDPVTDSANGKPAATPPDSSLLHPGDGNGPSPRKRRAISSESGEDVPPKRPCVDKNHDSKAESANCKEPVSFDGHAAALDMLRRWTKALD